MNAVEQQAEAVLRACQEARERERSRLFRRETLASERAAAHTARALIRAESRAWEGGMPTYGLTPLPAPPPVTRRQVDWGAVGLWAVALGVCVVTWYGVFTLVGRALDGGGWWR